MKKSLLVASTFLFGISGAAFANEAPTFAEADMDSNGTLDVRELREALPELELENTATSTVTTADVKQVLPEVDFDDEDVVNARPIREEQYDQIVDAINNGRDNATVSSVE